MAPHSLLSFLITSALLFGAGVSSTPARQAPDVPVLIEIGDSTVQLAPVDADAFQRRLARPPRLDDRPVTGSLSYTVTTPYWDEALGQSDEDASTAAEAAYFPQSGFVRVRHNQEDAWIVIDSRQRAILDRYIRLAEEGAIGRSPGVLEVLAAAASDETFGVQIGDRVLTGTEVAAFWRLASGLAPLDVSATEAPPVDLPGIWITVTLLEGRAVQLRYTPASGTLVDSLRQEVYEVPVGWLEPVLGPYSPDTLGSLTAAVSQQDPPGSDLWWFAMVGGGIALLVLALSLQNRIKQGS